MKTHITLADEPESYGDNCTPDLLLQINETLSEAARAADLGIEFPGESDPYDPEEIDWFAHWCAEGHTYTVEQWTEWLKKQKQ